MANNPKPVQPDFASIWDKLEEILLALGSSATPVGQVLQNIKIFPSVIPADATTALSFTLSDLAIGRYLFIPKSIQVQLQVAGAGADRAMLLAKYLDGIPVNQLNLFTNQSVLQTDGTIEDYFFNSDNSENDSTFDYGGITKHILALPSSFACQFNGVANNDFLSLIVKDAQATDLWINVVGQPIVAVGDVLKLND